jgi:hypothetical protein
VHALNLFARAVLLDIELQADESEGNRNWLAVRIGTLRGVGIDDVLMDEGRIGMRERVIRKLVILLAAGRHGCSCG